MISRHALVAAAVGAILASALPAPAQQPSAAPRETQPEPSGPAAGKGPPPSTGPTARRSQLYGDELFTPEERREFFDRMKAAKTPEERAKLQAERRATAEARAKEKGVALPPPAPGPGPGAPKAQ
ncbi:MAG TPA: hypothetical protein VLD36_01680 [Burkholderiales bacterium]|nr:hypothetical protein [Burkholderiales bacterium]